MTLLKLCISGYIEESVGRIEQATAEASVTGQQTSDQGQTVNSVEQGEGHTLGSNSTDTLQQPSAEPSAEEVRERRLAFFNQPVKNIADETSVSENGVVNLNDTETGSGGTQSGVNKTAKMASK